MKTIMFKKILWLYKQGALIPYQSPHKAISLNGEEEKELLSISNAYFIRYNSSFDIEESQFWYIIKDSFGGLEELSSKMRNQVKKGKKSYYTKIIDRTFMLEYAYDIYYEASRIYNTFEDMMSEAEFKNYIESLGDKYEFWGVFENESDKFCAYSQNFIDDKSCFYEEIFSIPSSLKKYSSYALFYDMNEYYLKNEGFNYVYDGSRSLSHDTSIHDFLISKFKFRKAFVKLHLVYRNDVKLAVKILYPFRNIIKEINLDIFKKITVLLNHEEIGRSFE